MKALILAAGEGTRLRPLTADRPKPMLPVGGIPLLEQIVSLLKRHGIEEIAINLHYKPWTIVQHLGLGQGCGVQIHYSFEEKLLGSAGAAKRLEWYFDQSFVVFYGDVYTEMDLSALMAEHNGRGALVTMALYAVNNPTECGIAELDAESRICRFVEKPAPDQVFSRLANAGIFVVEPEVLSWLPADEHLDFGRDVFPGMLAAGQTIIGYPIAEPLIDIGTPVSYQKAQHLASQRAASHAQAGLASLMAGPGVEDLFKRYTLSGAVEHGVMSQRANRR